MRKCQSCCKGMSSWYTCMCCQLGGGGCDIVLGTQWLGTSGVIQWDFKLLTMRFFHNHRQVLLQGLRSVGSQLKDGDTFLKQSIKRGLVL